MRKQKGFIAAIVALSIIISTAVMPFNTKAASNFSAVEETVNVALAEKNFYYFNLAFERIMQLEDESERNTLLSKLDTITETVWTQDISEIVANFVVIVLERSGQVYDETQAKINKSSLKEIDKQYLLHELNTWGKNTVWTKDYIKAIDSIIKVWYDKTQADADAAEAAIAELDLEANQVYLTDLLDEAKVAVGLIKETETPVEEVTPGEEVVIGDEVIGETPSEEVVAGEVVTDETPAESVQAQEVINTEVSTN